MRKKKNSCKQMIIELDRLNLNNMYPLKGINILYMIACIYLIATETTRANINEEKLALTGDIVLKTLKEIGSDSEDLPGCLRFGKKLFQNFAKEAIRETVGQLDEQVEELVTQLKGNVQVKGPPILGALFNHVLDDCSVVMKEARKNIESIVPQPSKERSNQVFKSGFDIANKHSDKPALHKF